MARYRALDFFLYTLPCNASTTASDVLWAGVPVVTRPGTTFAGRVGGKFALGIADAGTYCGEPAGLRGYDG